MKPPRAIAPLLLLALAQCSALSPFEGPAPAADQHSLCYSRANATPDQLHSLAAQACGGGAPRFLDQSLDLTACPLLVPVRLSFACGT